MGTLFWKSAFIIAMSAVLSSRTLATTPKTPAEKPATQKVLAAKQAASHIKRFHFGIDWTHSKWFVALDQGPVSSLKRMGGHGRSAKSPSPVMRYDIGMGVEYPQGVAGPGLWLPNHEVELFYDSAHASHVSVQRDEALPELSNAFWLDDPIDVEAYRKAATPESKPEVATPSQDAMPSVGVIELPDMADDTVPSFIAAPGTGLNYPVSILENNLKIGMVYRRSVLGATNTTNNPGLNTQPTPPVVSGPTVVLPSSEFVVKVIYDF